MQTDIAIISAKFKEVKQNLAPRIGALMLQFTDQRFREQGWVDDYSLPWQRRKKNREPGRAILIKTGNLRRSVRIVTITENSVTIGSDLKYAKANNDGFRGKVQVKQYNRTRSIATRKNNVERAKKGGKAFKIIGPIIVRPHGMNMLVQRRRFMGASPYLTLQIKRLITADINKCFK